MLFLYLNIDGYGPIGLRPVLHRHLRWSLGSRGLLARVALFCSCGEKPRPRREGIEKRRIDAYAALRLSERRLATALTAA